MSQKLFIGPKYFVNRKKNNGIDGGGAWPKCLNL